MSAKRNITEFPAELRQQIFAEYFKVQGGYAYDVESDKLRNAADSTPIDLSLMYTCRSIANDCKHLPLTVNTVHFSTVYREDWRSLAACFNIAATYYRVLQENMVLHLAHLITPEMYEKIEGEFPTFRTKFEEARKEHFYFWHEGADPPSAEALHDAEPSGNVQQSTCGLTEVFYREMVCEPMNKSPLRYRGYAHADQRPWLYRRERCRSNVSEAHLQIWDSIYNEWDDTASSEVHRCLPQLLALIADQNPEEFANRVFIHLPHWRDTYSAEEFLHMKLGLESWAIPSWSQLSIFLERLGLPATLWTFPDTWSYDHQFMEDLTEVVGTTHRPDHYENPPVDFHLRIRERTRFSAAAAFIRFIGLLPHNQRKQLRTINLHEDLPAVNIVSLHGHGLLPLLRENTNLKIQRRVSIVDCMMDLYPPIRLVQNSLLRGLPSKHIGERFVSNLSYWLLDALSVANAGIRSNSFSLQLDSGPYADFCTKAFDQLVHGSIARVRAWEYGLKAGLVRHESNEAIRCLTRKFAYASELGFEEAVMQLVNQSSNVLQCDFNPGLPHDRQNTLDKVNNRCVEMGYGVWEHWFLSRDLGLVKLPDCFSEVDRVARIYDIQSGDQYLESQGRILSPVRSVHDTLQQMKDNDYLLQPCPM